MVARDAGLDKFVMVSSPDMLRSAVKRNLGSGHAEASPRTVARLASHHQMSLQRREGACGDVQDHYGAGPGETPPQLGRHGEDSSDLMLEGFEWRARPLDKVFDADRRAVLKRCIAWTRGRVDVQRLAL